jgi:hypothetical protein
MTACTHKQPGDDPDLRAVGEYVAKLGYSGVSMVSKPCTKCKMLHHWRIVTNFPPGEGKVEEILRFCADMIESGTPVDLLEKAPPQ